MSIYVTGATGELGGLVIRHLLQQVSAGQITAVVHHEEKAAPLRELGVQVRRGDYNDPASLLQAFGGADRLLFIPSPESDDPLRIIQHAHVVKAARDAGVKHIAYVGYAFAEESVIPLAHVHLATEQMIRTTKIPYTFLRNPLYTEVFINPGLAASVARGGLVTNTGTGSINSVTRNDLAKAAAAVLSGEGHENKTYNLVSGQPWSFDSLAAILSEATGKQIAHQSVSFEEQKNILLSDGLPEPVAGMIAGIYQAVAAGETAKKSSDLQQLIGSETPLRTTVQQALQPQG